mgnify:CR=1 FL=1
MSLVDRPIGDPKHTYLTPSERAAMSSEALRAHIYFERNRIKREESDTEKRRQHLALAARGAAGGEGEASEAD